ncbi:hypothetical protein A9Q98_15615 [Thalassotalea sp. 42_200_T64]|nr:hypothetical protein A9Q98_15615 [Thalassotalea sp. 42_200_T64]
MAFYRPFAAIFTGLLVSTSKQEVAVSAGAVKECCASEQQSSEAIKPSCCVTNTKDEASSQSALFLQKTLQGIKYALSHYLYRTHCDYGN